MNSPQAPKKGVLILYYKLSKALRRLLKSTLLFYKKLCGDLEGMDFEVNAYDPCRTNRMVNRNQMTVA